jgi:hypothetical protein
VLLATCESARAAAHHRLAAIAAAKQTDQYIRVGSSHISFLIALAAARAENLPDALEVLIAYETRCAIR